MNKQHALACCLILLLGQSGPSAETPPCCEQQLRGCQVEQMRTVNRTILNATLTKTTCTVEVPVKKEYTVQTRDVPAEVPYTKLTPVCVKDPVTGRTHTELRPETILRKATTTYILVLPPDGPDTTRKEERTTLSLQVKIGHKPAEVVEKVPVPCGKRCR